MEGEEEMVLLDIEPIINEFGVVIGIKTK